MDINKLESVSGGNYMSNKTDNLQNKEINEEKAIKQKELESASGGIGEDLIPIRYYVNWDICKGDDPNGCGSECMSVNCKLDALEWENTPKPRMVWWLFKNRGQCNSCHACANACKHKAIQQQFGIL